MLRAAVLLLFLRGLHRFNTSGHPDALDACYVASWQLPRPDSHRLADDDLSGHTISWLGLLKINLSPICPYFSYSLPPLPRFLKGKNIGTSFLYFT